MAIQDRAFTSDGQLYYPAYKTDPLPGTDMTVGDVVPQKFYDTFGEDAPSVVPEFFGDTILVNGMAWPKLNVAAGDYEFRLLNGSDSRFYVLEVSDPNVAVHLVGTDGGLLHQAVIISDVRRPCRQHHAVRGRYCDRPVRRDGSGRNRPGARLREPHAGRQSR
jgi:spore coat protein A